jgi:hypothetical protein
MATEIGDKRSRRAILGATVGGLAALVAHGLARPERVAATDPNDLALGSTANTASTPTKLTASGSGYGFATEASAESVFAVWGAATGSLGTGLLGSAPGGGTGARGEGGAVGVFGLATGSSGNGVEGQADVGPAAYGVYGHSDPGYGVVGHSGSGIGVAATAGSGVALHVFGKARFDRSGRATVGATKSSIAVTVPGVTIHSWAVATLQQHVAGVYVTAAVPSANKVTIYLNKAVTAATKVGFFVIN